MTAEMVTFISKLDTMLATSCAMFFCEGEEEIEISEEATGIIINMLEIHPRSCCCSFRLLCSVQGKVPRRSDPAY